jgi:hypothetical protein
MESYSLTLQGLGLLLLGLYSMQLRTAIYRDYIFVKSSFFSTEICRLECQVFTEVPDSIHQIFPTKNMRSDRNVQSFIS